MFVLIIIQFVFVFVYQQHWVSRQPNKHHYIDSDKAVGPKTFEHSISQIHKHWVRVWTVYVCVRQTHVQTVANMTDENSISPSITSTTGFGDCNTSSVSSSTEQFIICCKVCGSLNGLRRCSRCKSVYYCSQVHQQVDWRVHKIECKKFASNLVTSE